VLAPGSARASTPAPAGEAAVPADVHEVLRRMRAALEPGTSMRATFDLAIANRDDTVHWVGTYYRRSGPEARTRMVFDAPADLRGTQVSVRRDPEGLTHTRIYLPLIRRVRDLQRSDASGESFLGTDFQYEDLGLERLAMQRHALQGACAVDGRPGLRVESVPAGDTWYGRIVRCVDREHHLPLRTEYYDRAGILWKLRRLGGVETIAGHRVPTEITMETVPERTSTRLTFTDVVLDGALPPDAFEITPPEPARAGDAPSAASNPDPSRRAGDRR
jgi:hypothetical protein